MKIVTDYCAKPIPMRHFDWSAKVEGWEPGLAVGYGATEDEAVAELLERLEERAEATFRTGGE